MEDDVRMVALITAILMGTGSVAFNDINIELYASRARMIVKAAVEACGVLQYGPVVVDDKRFKNDQYLGGQ